MPLHNKSFLRNLKKLLFTTNTIIVLILMPLQKVNFIYLIDIKNLDRNRVSTKKNRIGRCEDALTLD